MEPDLGNTSGGKRYLDQGSIIAVIALGFIFAEAEMTQLELAREGTISPQMKLVAKSEGVEVGFVRQGVMEGTIVIPANTNHKNLIPGASGRGLALRSTPILAPPPISAI